MPIKLCEIAHILCDSAQLYKDQLFFLVGKFGRILMCEIGKTAFLETSIYMIMFCNYLI